MHWQLSYHSTGYIAAALLSTGLFIYLISLRGKSRQTWCLAIYFFMFMCLSVGFVLRTGIYSPEFAKPSSYIIGLYTAFSNVVLLFFVYSFPRNRHPLETKIAVGFLFLLGAFTYSIYVRNTVFEPVRYNFETQFFEFQDPKAAGPMGLALFLGFLWCLVVIVRKIIGEERDRRQAEPDQGPRFSYLFLESKEARAVRAFGLAIFFNMLFSLSYVAYTRGALTYADFQHILTAATGIQLFLYAVIYLNNSPQPTSFMVKLVGVAVVAVILVLGLVNRISFGYSERMYEYSRLGFLPGVRLAIERNDFGGLPEDVIYLAEKTEGMRLLFTRDPALRGQDFTREIAPVGPLSQQTRETDLEFAYPTRAGPRMIPVQRSHRSFADAQPDLFFATFVFADDGREFEVGFRYAPYRAMVHEASARMAALLVGTSALLLLAFPLFLRGGVINPLNVLVDGVRRVNHGDYEARVPVQIEDEIGFLSHWFNRMVSSIQRKNRELKDHADQLEEKVKERTGELQNSLEEVQELKVQQDGDYWLLSLLVDPLGTNQVHSGVISVDFFMKQRKEFAYQKWSGEIGGDICVAHTVVLRGKRYVVFINGDAMGKSIQGAGGALVLGSVFDAMIKRTSRSSLIQSQFPERWLKNSFIELSNVFSSFQGNMLVSVFIGLVDEETGLLYFMQAEHPNLVLLRDGKADAVRATFQYPKLGRPYDEAQLFINTLQLETGDMIFVGSDGREDIMVRNGRDEEYIQEDESFFAHCVVNGDGHMPQIFEEIKSAGSLIDDLSLIRIMYTGVRRSRTETTRSVETLVATARDFLHQENSRGALETLIEAHERDPQDRRVLRLVVSTLWKMQEYDRAARFAIRYSRLEPGHVETLFVISKCYRNLGELQPAADFGERVRLRDPGHIKNLVHLAEIHMKLGDVDRARSLSREIQVRDPGHSSTTSESFPFLN